MAPSDYTGSSSTQTWYNTGYCISQYIPKLSLKEMRKIWAQLRMKMILSEHQNEHKIPSMLIYNRPVPLRGVKLNGHGWAI